MPAKRVTAVAEHKAYKPPRMDPVAKPAAPMQKMAAPAGKKKRKLKPGTMEEHAARVRRIVFG